MVQIKLMVVDLDQEITKLEFLIRQNGFLSVELLKLHPFWGPLREMDAFKTLINNPEY